MHARRRVRLARFPLMTTLLLGWACAEQATAPNVPEPHATQSFADSASPTSSTAVDVAVDVVERSVPLAEEERVSRTIGVMGGLIVLPRAGLTATVPPGALTAPTRITVIAPAGTLLGYHFLPEGLTFQLPLVVQQSLLGTELGGGSLDPGKQPLAAYFEGELSPVVSGLELLTLDVLGQTGVFRVRHFSGYVIGTS